MKLFLSAAPFMLLSTALARNGFEAVPFHEMAMEARKLTPESAHFGYFLVSNISKEKAWCITAVEGTNFGNLKLKPCDFDGAPPEQLWFPGAEGQIQSVLEEDKCITVNHGANLFNSARARLSDCDNGLTSFSYDGDGRIHVVDDPSFCLTNRGPNPHPGDWIHAKKCQERPDFYFTAIPQFTFSVMIESEGGCIQARDGTTRIYLDECTEDLAWRVEPLEETDYETALLHSCLDDTKCLRAGKGPSYGDGTQMRLAPCDANDPQQHILPGLDGRLHIAEDLDLCIVYHGVTANVGVDPIILKDCDVNDELWNIIDLSPGP